MFLAFLLALIFISRPLYCLVAPVDLIVSLTIGGVVLTKKDIAVSLSRFSWWNLLSSFQKCYIAMADS